MGVPSTGQATYAADPGDGSNGVIAAGQHYWINGVSVFSGSGAPNGDAPAAGGLGPPVLGDLYIRVDGGVGSTLYRCTVAGPGAVWAAIL
jgi:hypothetical protein